jgi:3-deoxy-D-manno-octulosonate 8-phosphate phosphatase (KDO 8-P phosphatase)
MTEQELLKPIRFIVTDFDGVLTDGQAWYDGEGRPFRSVNARDAAGFTLWRLGGGLCAIVTGLSSVAVERIAHDWRCAECHMSIKDKARVVREMAERHEVALSEIAYIGDDLIDVPAMEIVGVGVAVSDAMPVAQRAARLQLASHGGRGAFRELVERILTAQGRLEEVMKQYISRSDGAMTPQ